jgi:hypothetical protein
MEPITGTTLEILAPYLPYGIEVETPRLRGLLLGINAGQFQCPVETRQPEKDAGGILCGLWNYDFKDITPVLRPFADLGNQANRFRTNAAAHAAMMELAAALNGCDVVEIADAGYSVGHSRERIWLDYQNDDGDLCSGEVWDNGAALDANNEPIQMADWLRRHHFAVGLEPHQFIEKR